ncbi:FkbM family methyltransferase [Flavobacterium sp. W4I14]|nr:FkbM family methyltransferase [Flavobacterium sp. W4I14]
MSIISLYKFILRRPFFRGQDRIFNFLFNKGFINSGIVKTSPLTGNFVINADTSTWIGAKIDILGDYEPEIKKIFRIFIKEGNTVLDVGANIGLHTLYFSELVGSEGKVIAFEPIPSTFQLLQENIKLNNFENIEQKNIALSNRNETIKIKIDEKSKNPGSFNLFELDGDISVQCCIGDDLLINERLDFVKIDVEGFEVHVIQGLFETLHKFKPVIVFEYDYNYQKKAGLSQDHIFRILGEIGYQFYEIKKNTLILFNGEKVKSCNVLAKQKGND